ncbi:hypothetical protein DFH09DRAFT_1285812 [Mycena vulgaris]|nr:hypothetical protein DFH09DRAFT_1285812 [Mycena vulgaris]
MAKLGSVDSLVYALQYKETLIKTSSDLGVAGHSKLKVALEADQAALGDHVVEVLYSPADERVVLALEDNAAQSLLDIIQHTLDNTLLHTRDATSKARRLIGKLAKACDKLPSSLIITGVAQRDEHASFRGGFGDEFKAMYQGKPVALKHMRMFQGTDQRDIRRMSATPGASARAKITDSLLGDASALGALVWELAAGRRPSLQDRQADSQWPPLSVITSRTPAFPESIQMCFDPAATQFGYRRLIESMFIREACERATLAQLLVQFTAFEGRLRERRPR